MTWWTYAILGVAAAMLAFAFFDVGRAIIRWLLGEDNHHNGTP